MKYILDESDCKLSCPWWSVFFPQTIALTYRPCCFTVSGPISWNLLLHHFKPSHLKPVLWGPQKKVLLHCHDCFCRNYAHYESVNWRALIINLMTLMTSFFSTLQFWYCAEFLLVAALPRPVFNQTAEQSRPVILFYYVQQWRLCDWRAELFIGTARD